MNPRERASAANPWQACGIMHVAAMTDASLPPSPFLALPPTAYVARNELAFAIPDGYPVTPGHTLVIPFRHVATWCDAARDEQNALLTLVDEIKRQLDRGVPHPDGTARVPD